VEARDRGQAVVEFGLIALTLVFLVGSGIDLGLMVTVRQNVSAATAEAARQAAYGAPVPDVIQAALRAATGTLADPSGLAVSVQYCTPSGTCNATYCYGFPALDRVKPPNCSAPPPSPPGPAAQPGDLVTVTLWEEKYEILTPIIRAWAASPLAQDDLCQRGDQPCYLRLTTSETVTYPGPAPQ
jgi:hypothetical protein